MYKNEEILKLLFWVRTERRVFEKIALQNFETIDDDYVRKG